MNSDEAAADRMDLPDEAGSLPATPVPDAEGIAQLIAVMVALRTPVTGCPWDLEQTFETIAPYTIEEAYEVADAIQRGDRADLRDELGDLLLQVVYHAQLAKEEGAFDFDDVAKSVSAKMIRRHPHVFGDRNGRRLAAHEVKGLWERIKSEERAEKAGIRAALADALGDAEVDDAGKPVSEPPSALDDVAVALPALLRAEKLQKRASRYGFDWGAWPPVIAKIEEEIAELKEAAAAGQSDAIEDELGDVLFAVANAARHLGVDPEAALRRTNEKFRRRWRHMEGSAAEQGVTLETLDLAQQEALWTRAKQAERGELE